MRWQLATATLGLLLAAPAHADRIRRWQPLIDQAAMRFGIPVDWIARVMRAESAGMTTMNGRPITSRAGAMGLMQLMPATWMDMRASLRLGDDPYDPHDNILAGTFYLRLLYDRFGYPGLFAAYNAGPGRYTSYLGTGRRLPSETRAYLANVGGVSAAPSIPAEKRAPPPIFFSLRTSGSIGSSRPDAVPDRLFVTLDGVTKRP